jgi:CubicO group peptidase (beta-lactamase class C family)
MVRRGEVGLDDPASKHSRAGAKLPSRNGREITLRDLVTQTSALPRMPPGFSPSRPDNPFADFGADALYDALARTELTRDIGQASEYSNFGFMWLSEMLARRGGKPFDVLLAERVLAPLGMDDTSVALSASRRARLVTGHAPPYAATPPWDFPAEVSGVGGLRSTLDDMVKLAAALAGRRGTPLDDTIALAMEPMRSAGGPGMIGYAWFERGDTGKRIHWHNGGTGGFRSMVAVDRSRRVAAVVLVDAAVSFDDLALHLADPNQPIAFRRASLATDAAMRDQYVGRYQLAPQFVITVFAEGEYLMAQATNQGRLLLLRTGEDEFAVSGVAARITFQREAGKVARLTLHQNGRDTPGARLP